MSTILNFLLICLFITLQSYFLCISLALMCPLTSVTHCHIKCYWKEIPPSFCFYIVCFLPVGTLVVQPEGFPIKSKSCPRMNGFWSLMAKGKEPNKFKIRGIGIYGCFFHMSRNPKSYLPRSRCWSNVNILQIWKLDAKVIKTFQSLVNLRILKLEETFSIFKINSLYLCQILGLNIYP